MSSKFSLVLVSAAALMLGACAHHRDVRPSADGIHRVVISTDDQDQGAREAIEQANHFCKERGLQAAFVNEESKYKGDISESSYKTAKKATTAAKILGGTTYVMGGAKESSIGGLVGLGGVVGDGVLGKGYSVEMKFKCM
ncbi:hypothetical protein D3C87_1299340 [compost metagenome]